MKRKRPVNSFSNSGFSLVEAIIGIGLSTAAALIIFKALEESNKGQKIAENRDSVSQFTRELISRFGDRQVCTSTLIPAIATGNLEITKVIDQKGNVLFNVPTSRGNVTLKGLKLKNVAQEGQAQVLATFEHKVAGKVSSINKNFTLEMSFNPHGGFDGCIAGSNLSVDPKEACDLILGSDGESNSYFHNGICHFAQASCEKSGRIWNPESLRCDLSEEDREVIREEVCNALGFTYSATNKKCELTEEQKAEAKRFSQKTGP